MSNYYCKVASISEMMKKYDYEIDKASEEDKTNWYYWKDLSIKLALNKYIDTYIGILDDEIICELKVVYNPACVQNSNGLVDDKTVYLEGIRTNKEYENKGYFSSLFKYTVNDLKKRGYDRITLGVEPQELRNNEIYKHLGFTNYIKEGIVNYPNGDSIKANYYYKDLNDIEFKELKTEHLILRKAKESDLNNIFNNVWSDKRIADNMLWEVTDSIEEAKNRLERTIAYQKRFNAYFVCLKDTDEAIGFCGVRLLEADVYEESGICIATNYQGKGYGKEVVGALLDLVFNKLKGRRFVYDCFVDNEKSRRTCLAYGFKYFESKNIVREHDNKEFTLDYYYLDRDMYK